MTSMPRRLTLLAGVCAAALAVGACDDDKQQAADQTPQTDTRAAPDRGTTQATPKDATKPAGDRTYGSSDRPTEDRAARDRNAKATDRDRTRTPGPAQSDTADAVPGDRPAPESPQTERKPDPVDGPVLATGRLQASNGKDMGTIEVMEVQGRGVVVRFETTGLPPGPHAIHFHEKGVCEGPDFKTAGEHWRPRNWQPAETGRRIDPGHLGTIDVDDQGHVETSLANAHATLKPNEPNTLFDDDGVSIVIHEKPDANAARPGGDAGARIACAVITPRQKVEGK